MVYILHNITQLFFYDTNFSPTFLIHSSTETKLCAARYVIQIRMLFQDGGHFLQSRQQTTPDTCSSSQQPLSNRRY